jgi:hypothetical protein
MRLCRADAESHAFKDGAILGRDAYHGNTMHRCAAAPVAAQRDDDVATVGVAALRLVVRPVDVQTHFFQQPFGRYQCDRQAEAQRRQHFVDARFVLAGVGANDPQRVGMLLEGALLEAHHGPSLTFGVYLRGAEPVAHAFLVHEVQEVGLGRLAEYVAGEVHVLGRAFDNGAGAQIHAHELSPASLREALGHAGRTKIAAAVVRQNGIAGDDRLDGALRAVAHRHLSPGCETLIIIAHHEGHAVWLGQQHQPLVLDGIGILKFVHQYVLETGPIVLQQRGVVAP